MIWNRKADKGSMKITLNEGFVVGNFRSTERCVISVRTRHHQAIAAHTLYGAVDDLPRKVKARPCQARPRLP